jgi:TetR/AcrR family transcriptional regulator, regulator of autoinduction and epiphytic fitness
MGQNLITAVFLRMKNKPSRSELKREAIVEAAKLAFKEYGVNGTSMDKLAEMAGVTKRTVYNHFESKEALAMYLMTDLWQNALVQIKPEYDSGKPLEEQLFTLLKTEVDLVSSQENIDMTRMALGHLFYNPEALQKEFEKYPPEDTALFKWLQLAADDGKLTITDVGFAYDQLGSMIKGSCFWPQLIKIKETSSEEEKVNIAKEATRIFIAGYKV